MRPRGPRSGTAIATSAGATSWTVYDYNPSGQALAPRVSPGSSPATISPDGTVSFHFLADTYTALLTTNDKSLTGDLSGKTLSDRVSVTGMSPDAVFQDQNNGGCLPDNQSVRLYFTSPQAAGTTGFFTQFWWSNPASLTLTNDVSGTIIASLDPSQWSDWNGHEANFSPEVTAAFITASQNVQTVGLSFGGGCFFENGVTTSDGSGIFSSQFSESP